VISETPAEIEVSENVFLRIIDDSGRTTGERRNATVLATLSQEILDRENEGFSREKAIILKQGGDEKKHGKNPDLYEKTSRDQQVDPAGKRGWAVFGHYSLGE